MNTKMPDSADSTMAFQVDSFANSLLTSLQESKNDIAKSHSITNNIFNLFILLDSKAEAYTTMIVEPLYQIKGQVKAEYNEIFDVRALVEKERNKDAQDIKDLHKALQTSLQYFTVNKGMHHCS